MKTTIEIPDEVFREAKARAALAGKTLKSYFNEAIREKNNMKLAVQSDKPGWMKVAGTIPHEEIEKIQKLIDEEFSKIDPEDWK